MTRLWQREKTRGTRVAPTGSASPDMTWLGDSATGLERRPQAAALLAIA